MDYQKQLKKAQDFIKDTQDLKNKYLNSKGSKEKNEFKKKISDQTMKKAFEDIVRMKEEFEKSSSQINSKQES